MANINYELIGTHPGLESQAGNLPYLIKKFQTNAYLNALDRAVDASLIEMLAAHIYGIDPVECGSMDVVIDAINSAEQELEFA